MSEGLHLWGAEGARPVLLLHCTLAHGGAWKRVARHLSDRFRLIAPDMVAHGQGPPGDRARDFHDQTTEHAAGFLPEAPTHLVGHSFGATVALRMAIEAPDRVASLTLFEPVLFAAAPDGSEKRANAETLARMEPMIAAGDERDAARLFLSVWGSGEDFDALPKGEAARMAAQMWMIPAQRTALHDDKARLLPRLGQVRCPVLLMEGAASPPVIGQILDTLEAGLSDVRREKIEGAGHMAPITHAEEVAAVLGDFLDAATQQGAGKRALSG
ncbi:MAG: putative hydrolases or acyltransferases (alpha/beta hydrolase superfamily) [Rhodobacteraceae bacterium HLUCCO18]|nr:MAG: putative hydrolases or acyltransferases (alpha/beta hydrolase superfamily) [Rhodobacteraceae bacterium HLUCCO18]